MQLIYQDLKLILLLILIKNLIKILLKLILCDLYVIYIIAIIFDNIIFDKINSSLGLFLNSYLFNIINLAYYFHNKYNKSNKIK